MHRKNSRSLYQTLCALLPGGVNSPVRAFFGLDMTPLIVESGQGAKVKDIDGKEYIDYCGSWGALILGHAHPAVTDAAAHQIYKGTSFGITTPYEAKIAEKIRTHFPSMEKLRFVSSGTEATMSALRVARGFTGKSIIVKFDGNYHGHSDPLLVHAGSGVLYVNNTASSKGVLQEQVAHTVSLPYNNEHEVRAFLEETADIAAVIIEPICGNMGTVPADPSFLHMLRRVTEKRGILLIFDEVITGFRVGLKGAQGVFNLHPDLTCLGKIVGGGFPAAAFGGRKEIMESLAPLGEVYQAGTLSGNPVAMRAGLATLEEIEKPGFYELLEQKSDELLAPIRACIQKNNFPVQLQSFGSMFTLFFSEKPIRSKEDLRFMDAEKFKKFFHYLFEKGVYFPPSPYEAAFVSAAHTKEELQHTQEVIQEALTHLFT